MITAAPRHNPFPRRPADRFFLTPAVYTMIWVHVRVSVYVCVGTCMPSA